MWYLKKGVILTKDNLAKTNWEGNKGCPFCNTPESIRHLFFSCVNPLVLMIFLIIGQKGGGNQSQFELIDCSRRIMLVAVDIKK